MLTLKVFNKKFFVQKWVIIKAKMIVKLRHSVQDQTRIRHDKNYQYNNCFCPQPQIYHLIQKYREKYIDIEIIHNRPVNHDRRLTLLLEPSYPIISFRPSTIIVTLLMFNRFKYYTSDHNIYASKTSPLLII